MATYYETTDFLAPIEDSTSLSHTAAERFTQVDVSIDLNLGELPVTLKSGSHFPSQFFSVRWTGFLMPKYTETYRLYIFSQKTAAFSVKLDGQTVIENNFDLAYEATGTTTVPKSGYFPSADIELTASKLN